MMPDAPVAAPTRARFTLIYLTLILSVITYVDRVAISSAAPAIRDDLGLSPVEMAWVFSAFTFAYAAFEIPSGWLGDVIGPRTVLARIVLWWSAFTALTGAAWNYPSLVIARFLFGVGEAGAFPNISRSFASWIPVAERGAAHGLVLMGSRAGGAITPIVVVGLMTWIGWRKTFLVLGVLGLVWCVFWLRWFTDDPGDHRAVNAAELACIRGGLASAPAAHFSGFPWRAMLSANLLLICLMYFCVGYTLYFNLTWLPIYLREARGLTTAQAGLVSSIVLMCGAIGTWAGGQLTDYLVRRHGLKVGRSVGAIALPVSGVLVLGAALVPNSVLAVVLLALTLGIADLSTSPSWSMCHDIGGARAGVVTGAMNTLGNVGGAISPLVVGYAVEWWGSWTLPFFITAGIYITGGLLTLAIDPRRPLWPQPSGSPLTSRVSN